MDKQSASTIDAESALLIWPTRLNMMLSNFKSPLPPFEKGGQGGFLKF
jgi:hypothetical protein